MMTNNVYLAIHNQTNLSFAHKKDLNKRCSIAMSLAVCTVPEGKNACTVITRVWNYAASVTEHVNQSEMAT